MLDACAPGGDLDALRDLVGRDDLEDLLQCLVAADELTTSGERLSQWQHQLDALLSRRRVGQHPERRGQPPRGCRRCLRASLLGRLAGAPQPQPTSPWRAERSTWCARALAGAPRSARAAATRSMSTDAPAAGSRFVDGAAHDRVAEPESTRHVGFSDELQHARARLSPPAHRSRQHRRQRPQDRSRTDRPPPRRHRGPAEPDARAATVPRPARRRPSGGTCTPASVHLAASSSPTTCPPTPGELLEIERVPSGLVVEQLGVLANQLARLVRGSAAAARCGPDGRTGARARARWPGEPAPGWALQPARSARPPPADGGAGR